jgi:hypothetical protein
MAHFDHNSVSLLLPVIAAMFHLQEVVPIDFPKALRHLPALQEAQVQLVNIHPHISNDIHSQADGTMTAQD